MLNNLGVRIPRVVYEWVYVEEEGGVLGCVYMCMNTCMWSRWYVEMCVVVSVCLNACMWKRRRYEGLCVCEHECVYVEEERGVRDCV